MSESAEEDALMSPAWRMSQQWCELRVFRREARGVRLGKSGPLMVPPGEPMTARTGSEDAYGATAVSQVSSSVLVAERDMNAAKSSCV